MSQSIVKQILIIIGIGLSVFILAISSETASLSTRIQAIPASSPTNKLALIDPSAEAEDALNQKTSAPLQATQIDQAETQEIEPLTADRAPEGYVDSPPLCGTLINLTPAPHSLPWALQVQPDPYQSEVVVNRYDFYINDVLSQSSASNRLNFNPETAGTYTVHAILQTNFGETLKNVYCEAQFTITGDMLKL